MVDDSVRARGLENYRIQKYVALLGIFLMSVKFVAWLITDSVAILTDAMESIVNIVAAFFGLYALHMSAKPKDLFHPYGHGKIELVSSSFEGLMIIVAGSIILLHSITHIIYPEPVTSLDVGLILVLFSALLNYLAGRFAIYKGRSNRSMALIASGKHLCSDSYSSIGITIGLVLMSIFNHLGMNFWWLDPLLACIFGTIILVTGLKVVKRSVDGLIDRNDFELVEKVVKCINAMRHPHWVDFHDLRITKYGALIHMDFHIVLPMHMTVDQQCNEHDELTRVISEGIGDSVDFTIMVESCGGKLCKHCNVDCDSRMESFSYHLEWDADTITDPNEDHSTRHIPSEKSKGT